MRPEKVILVGVNHLFSEDKISKVLESQKFDAVALELDSERVNYSQLAQGASCFYD